MGGVSSKTYTCIYDECHGVCYDKEYKKGEKNKCDDCQKQKKCMPKSKSAGVGQEVAEQYTLLGDETTFTSRGFGLLILVLIIYFIYKFKK